MKSVMSVDQADLEGLNDPVKLRIIGEAEQVPGILHHLGGLFDEFDDGVPLLPVVLQLLKLDAVIAFVLIGVIHIFLKLDDLAGQRGIDALQVFFDAPQEAHLTGFLVKADVAGELVDVIVDEAWSDLPDLHEVLEHRHDRVIQAHDILVLVDQVQRL
jgi:hypothetical protein